MWLLCHHVVSFIVIQRDVIKWIVIFAIIPATLAATNLPVVLDTETGTSVYVSFLFRVLTDRNLNGPYQNIRTVLRNHSSKSVSLTSKMWSNSAFYNRCSELSPEIMSCSLVAAATLAASPCVDMSRCSISSSHSRGRSVCVLSLSIWYTSSKHSISSYLLYPLLATMEQVTMVRVIRVLGECRIVPSASLISELILFSHRIHWGAQGSISTTACRQVLCQGGVPFKVLKHNWTTISGSNNSWSWPRDCKWSSSIPYSPA